MFKRLLHQVGRRGAFLAFLAFLDYAFAWSNWYLPPPQPMVVPAHVWAVGWLAAAVACTVGVFLRRDRVPYTAASTVKAAFAAANGYEWLVKHEPYGWVNTLFWLVFALIVLMVASWPDPVLTESFSKKR